MPAQLKNGVQGAPGGYRKGAGRKPDKYKAALKKIARDPKALKFLKEAIAGEPVDVRLSDGEIVHLPPTADTRHKIWESVHDRTEGKPVSFLEMKDEDGNTMIPAVVMLPPRPAKEGK